MTPVKKRLIICCDGTWQNLETGYPTNVVKIAQAIKPVADDGTLQILFYDAGIGTERFQKILGGAFGRGIDEKILNAYRFLCFNYCGIDDEIYLFGFSRGAYTVRSLAGLISYCGLLPRYRMRDTSEAYELYRNQNIKSRNDERVKNFRAKNNSEQARITLLACWDTVGALGIPDLIQLPGVLERIDISDWNNKRYQFHDTTLSSIVQHALHAIAIDEYRKVFNVTPMEANPNAANQKLQQLWFPGDHGCVGGGTKEHRGLSDGALQWMIEQVRDWGLGLEFQADRVQYSTKSEPEKYGIYPDPLTPFTAGGGFRGGFRRDVNDFANLHDNVKFRWRDRLINYRPSNLKKLEPELQKWVTENPID